MISPAPAICIFIYAGTVHVCCSNKEEKEWVQVLYIIKIRDTNKSTLYVTYKNINIRDKGSKKKE